MNEKKCHAEVNECSRNVVNVEALLNIRMLMMYQNFTLLVYYPKPQQNFSFFCTFTSIILSMTTYILNAYRTF